jgi:hypothetical protein
LEEPFWIFSKFGENSFEHSWEEWYNRSKKIKEICPHVDISLRNFLCTPASTSSAEKSFRRLRRLKTCLHLFIAKSPNVAKLVWPRSPENINLRMCESDLSVQKGILFSVQRPVSELKANLQQDGRCLTFGVY